MNHNGPFPSQDLKIAAFEAIQAYTKFVRLASAHRGHAHDDAAHVCEVVDQYHTLLQSIAKGDVPDPSFGVQPRSVRLSEPQG